MPDQLELLETTTLVPMSNEECVLYRQAKFERTEVRDVHNAELSDQSVLAATSNQQ